MLNRFRGRSQVLALLLAVLSAVGALGWLGWRGNGCGDTSFLPRMAPAEWVVYPSGPDLMPHPRLRMSTVFYHSFELERLPSDAVLAVAGFHEYALWINNTPAADPLRRGRNWKRPDQYEVVKLLHAGTNEIAVEVFNTNGPPALWLSLEAGAKRLVSDAGWQASYAGAAWRPARLARQPALIPPGSPIAGGERPWPSLRARWPILLLFAALSAVACWVLGRLAGAAALNAMPFLRELLPVLVVAGLWAALFGNNLGVLAPLHGFDLPDHLAYIGYIQERHSLPLAGEGAEMFQPPLYYLLGAALLSLFSLSVTQDSAILALRVMGLIIGVAHVVLVWASLRLLFPGERSRAGWGLVLAAFLPPMLYLSHYVSNEGLAAALVSASVYLALRLLKQEKISWQAAAGLGLCLGAALLTKSTALLAVMAVVGALLWKTGLTPPASARLRLPHFALVLGVCVLVSGWHYARLWAHYGAPLTGVWDPRLGLPWWQEEGFQTGSFYLRFGHVLSHPLLGSLNSFADGIYSTLWGDGLLSGATNLASRAPWDYTLMAVGYWLALLPVLAILVGGVLALVKFIRQPSAEWFLTLGLAFLAALAMAYMTIILPYHCHVKAFYGLCALVPLCAFGAWGFDWFSRGGRGLERFLCIVVGVWALTSYAAFWISHSAAATVAVRSRVLSSQGRYREATALLQAGLAREPRHAEMRALLAEALAAAGDQAGAGRQAELAVRDWPDDAQARLTHAALLAGQERIGEAVREAQRAVELAPGRGQGYGQLAALHVSQTNWNEAIHIAREGLGLAPFSAELRFALGTALAADGQTNDAVAQLRLACEIKPAWPAPQALLGGLLTGQGRLDEATALYVRSGGANAVSAAPPLELAAALAAQGRDEEAISQYRAIVAAQPGADAARFGLGEALSRQRRYEEAAEQFREVLKLQPGRVPALVQLGVACARLGRAAEAEQALAEAVHLDPGDVGAHNNLGNVLTQQGKHEEAVRQFEEALRLKPDHANAHNNLALSCRELGRMEEAVAHFREAVRLEPNGMQALNNLAWTLATCPKAEYRNGAEAVELATRACERTKYQSPVPLATLGAAYAEAGRYQEAASFAEQARELVKGASGELPERLGEMLEAFRAGRPYRSK